MLIDQDPYEDVFARVPELAGARERAGFIEAPLIGAANSPSRAIIY